MAEPWRAQAGPGTPWPWQLGVAPFTEWWEQKPKDPEKKGIRCRETCGPADTLLSGRLLPNSHFQVRCLQTSAFQVCCIPGRTRSRPYPSGLISGLIFNSQIFFLFFFFW